MLSSLLILPWLSTFFHAEFEALQTKSTSHCTVVARYKTTTLRRVMLLHLSYSSLAAFFWSDEVSRQAGGQA